MDKTEVIAKLKEYKKLLSKQMKFDDLILFGSYAKGTQKEDSDVDVAIVLDETSEDYFYTRPLIWRLSRVVVDRIEPLIIERKYDDSGFLEEIIKTGVVI